MTIRKLAVPQALERPRNLQWDVPSDVLSRWAERPLAAESDDGNTISIYEMIGQDFWTGAGFTAKRAAAALRSIGKADVTVKINSPGGDLFEGIAIYNLLREHPAKVTVDVMGYAASAASIVAMAGDDIRMGLGTFMMVHCAWGLVVGNRHDMRDAADLFATFDSAIADIYEARTGQDRKAIDKLMDKETWMSPNEAIENGFADAILEGVSAKAEAAPDQVDRRLMARRQVEAALARAGLSRNSRSELLAELTDPAARDAGRPAPRDAGGLSPASVRELIDIIKR